MAFPPSTRRNEPPILPVRQGPPIQLPLRDITDSDTDAPPQRPHPAADTVARCGPWAYPPPVTVFVAPQRGLRPSGPA